MALNVPLREIAQRNKLYYLYIEQAKELKIIFRDLVYMIFCKGIFSIKYFNAINHQHSTLSNDKKEIHTSWNMMEISTQIHCDTCWHNCSKSLFLLTGFDLSPTVWRRHHLTVSWMPIELRLIFQSLIVQSDKWHLNLRMMYDFSNKYGTKLLLTLFHMLIIQEKHSTSIFKDISPTTTTSWQL